jgi:hypothetical protein
MENSMKENDILPLSQRKWDWFFIIAFSAFIFTSFAADLVNGISSPSANHSYFWGRAVYDLYAFGNDPLLIANPRFLQVMCFISAFIFGPFYIVLVYSFIKGKNWIRPFALVYVGMIIESMIVLLIVEFYGDARLFEQMCSGGLKTAEELGKMGLTRELTVQNAVKFMLFNLPYKIIPILLAVRMWKDKPFSRK